MGRVSGTVALVTGAASGLGEAISLLLAQEGAQVVIADIAAEPGAKVVNTIRRAGGDASYVHLDVSQEADWQAVMRSTIDRYGKLNVLVNNAGIAPAGFLDISLDHWRRVMGVNLDGTFLGIKYAIDTMRNSGERGSIVNISSIMAMVGNSVSAAYSASKGGVRSLTKAAAMYCASERLPIRVNSIHPGACMTPAFKAVCDSQTAEWVKTLREKHPIGHFGDPADVAYGVLYLASDESKFVLGSELVIDGGWLASD